MSNPFRYEWHEFTKGRRLSMRVILQAAMLSIAAGLGPDILLILIGSQKSADVFSWPIRIAFVALLTIAFIAMSDIHDPEAFIMTTSTLEIGTTVCITRHVTAKTGRQFFVEWESLKPPAFSLDEEHHILQINTEWDVRAYKRAGTKKGRFVDRETRNYPQTLQLSPEAFKNALTFLRDQYPDKLQSMTPEAYEAAKLYILKHYGT